MGLCRCSVDNYSLQSWRPALSVLTAQSHMYDGGEHFLSAVSMTARIFSALATWNSVVSVHHINNFWNTRSNLTKFLGQSPQRLWIVCAKLHVKRLRIDWDINEKRSSDVVTSLAQCFPLITFEVLNQTPPNLLGSCRSSSRWCLQNYMKNGWELTSELTSKWIYILKYTSKFHINLINNIWSTLSNFTEFSRVVAIIPFDGACKITWKTVENWRLNWRLNE